MSLVGRKIIDQISSNLGFGSTEAVSPLVDELRDGMSKQELVADLEIAVRVVKSRPKAQRSIPESYS